MRLVRLPGIHHDANAHLVIGKEESWLIDVGTSWYQLLQVERMKSKIEQKNTVNKIFLSSRRFPYSGGAKFISEQFGDCSILVGDAAIPALSRGDFFSTWANRFDSDMPPIDCEPIVNGDHHYIDDELMVCIHTPGFALEGFSFYFENKGVCVAPSVIHRADLPIRWNLPGGQISELHDSIEELLSLELETLVPSKGPSIKGRGHIVEVLNRHLDFLSEVIDNEGELLRGWKRPVPTAMYFSPPSPWPLDEIEDSQHQ